MTGRFRAAAVLVIGLAACTTGPVAPEDVDECSGLVAVGVTLVADLLVAVESVPVEVLLGEAPPSPTVAALHTRGRALDLRAVELGCDPVELHAAVVARIADLQPQSPAGSALLELVRAGPGPRLIPAPGTTSG